VSARVTVQDGTVFDQMRHQNERSGILQQIGASGVFRDKIMRSGEDRPDLSLQSLQNESGNLAMPNSQRFLVWIRSGEMVEMTS
jgi:hypothetical protein